MKELMGRLVSLLAGLLVAFNVLASETRVPRIIALSPHLTELIFAAGAGDQLVGTVAFSDYPSAAETIPRIGDGAGLNIEAIAALKPDIVFYWPSGNAARQIEQLRALELKLVASDPQSFEQVASDLRTIGQLAGTSLQANRAADNFLNGMNQLRAEYQSRNKVNLFLEISRNPLITIGKESFVNEVFEVCGGENVFADVSQGWPQVSVEAIFLRQPAVILTGDSDTDAFTTYWQQWPQLQAVRHNRLYSINPDWLVRQTPRLLPGAKRICEMLDQVRRGK